MRLSQRRCLAGLTWLVLIVAPATALAEPLTLEAAVRRAVERHPALLAAADSSSAAVEGVGQAESYWLPRLSLVGSYRYTQPVAELVVDTGIILPGETEPVRFTNQIGTEQSASVGLQAGWRALDWGVRDAGIEAAEAVARASRHDEALRATDIAYAVRVAYLAAVFFDEAQAITDRSLETARGQLADREARRRSGLGSELEVASASARVAELDARLLGLQAQGELARETLHLLLGLSAGLSLELTDGLEALEPASTASERQAHPAMQRLDALADALNRQAVAVDRSFWPTLDLFATAAYQFPVTVVDVDEAGLTYTLGAALTWELFDGWLRSHREDELSSRASATRHARDASDEELERAERDAELRVRAASAQLVAASRQREAAETYLRVAETALSAGAGTALDVQTAESAVDVARLGELQAQLERALAEADWLRARGIGVIPVAAAEP